MKIRRICSKERHNAVRKVREELGPDAIIMSSRKSEDGFEIVAAIDFDETLINKALDAAQNRDQQGVVTPVVDKPSVKLEQSSVHENAQPGDVSIQIMRNEIGKLRGVMESQLAVMGWNKWSAQSPVKTALLKRLTQAGFGAAFNAEILQHLDGVRDITKGWQMVLGQLAARVRVTEDDIVSRGGVVALVGPTGVGKTTTIAKLVSRYVMRHGNSDVALVSTDHFRVGAHEQLMAYGQIIGVPVLTVTEGEPLKDILKKTQRRRLVLIDTAGMSQRDMRLSRELSSLTGASQSLGSYLVLSATAQMSATHESARAFESANLKGCIISKTDEAVSLGGVLTTAATFKLPVAYTTDGQCVPEDIERAVIHRLIGKAIVHGNTGEGTDNELMAINYGQVVANARA